MTLLSELKRRRVFRVAAMYGVTAWIIIEVSATVLPALHLPDQLITTIVVLLIAGFPIAMVLAWIFDINPDGIERTTVPVQGQEATDGRTTTVVATALVVLATVALGAFFYWRLAGIDTPVRDSIAVLPFVNLSADGTNDYFSDGISEELLNLLAKVPGLKVAARTSSFAYKGRDADVRSIAQQLGVATVLEGSVRWSQGGEQVRITAQLIDAQSGYHLWSDTFDRSLEDIFALQDEIAQSIVANLEPQFAGTEPTPLALRAPPTGDVEAYTHYLRGRALWQQGDQAALAQSIEHFQAALARDPGFARAYSNLSAAYVLLPAYSNEGRDELYAKANEAALTALTLDAQLAEAHAVLARIADDHWDWNAAETGFYFATSLAGDEAIAHHWYSLHLETVGRGEAALAEAELAATLDPENSVIREHLAALKDSAPADGLAPDNPANPEHFALSEAVLEGRVDDAFELATGLVLHNTLAVDRLWGEAMQPLRRDERFVGLMREIGLADYWRRYGWADACRPEGAGFSCS